MSALARWRALRRDEKSLVVQAAVWIARSAGGLRFLGVKRMLLAAERGEKKTGAHASYADLIVAIDRAGRYVPGGTCLAQSIALARMLRRRGIAAHVRVGVRTDAGFHAHAWVEVDGLAVTSESGHTALTHIA